MSVCSIVEWGVYVSMYACKVRTGGSEPCLFVICKEDRERARVLVSIERKVEEGASFTNLSAPCSIYYQKWTFVLLNPKSSESWK